MVRYTVWDYLCTRLIDCSVQSKPTSTPLCLHLWEGRMGKRAITYSECRCCSRLKLVDDSFISETRLEFESIQETIGEQTTNPREDGINNNRPPRLPVER